MNGKRSIRLTVGREEVESPVGTGGMAPGGLPGIRLGGLWRGPLGSSGVGVTTWFIRRTETLVRKKRIGRVGRRGPGGRSIVA